MICSLSISLVGSPMRRALQRSMRDVSNEWTRISVLVCVNDGWSLEMLRRWKNAVRVMF